MFNHSAFSDDRISRKVWIFKAIWQKEMNTVDNLEKPQMLWQLVVFRNYDPWRKTFSFTAAKNIQLKSYTSPTIK